MLCRWASYHQQDIVLTNSKERRVSRPFKAGRMWESQEGETWCVYSLQVHGDWEFLFPGPFTSRRQLSQTKLWQATKSGQYEFCQNTKEYVWNKVNTNDCKESTKACYNGFKPNTHGVRGMALNGMFTGGEITFGSGRRGFPFSKEQWEVEAASPPRVPWFITRIQFPEMF